MEIVLATRNMHKVREIRDILRAIESLDIVSLMNFPDYVPPEETGKTFIENAELKATHAAKALNRWVLADDSGLVVPAANGEPGVNSRRYAGEDPTDRDNNAKLLERMRELTGIQRSAFYECAVCVSGPDGTKKTASGYCEGVIIEEPRGRNGFGYDPLFLKHDHQKTFGELAEDTKNRISHRRKALDKISLFLESQR